MNSGSEPEYGLIPENTIIIIVNNITVSAKNISAFSLSKNSMILGIAYDNNGNSITPVIDFGDSVIESELININEGMIVEITIQKLELRYMSSNGGSFAPIKFNKGVIAKLTFDDCIVKGFNSTQVAGLNYLNSGVIRDSKVINYNISSQKWLALICYTNNGRVSNTTASNGTYSGSLNTSGVS